MAEEEVRFGPEFEGPLDRAGQVPIAPLLDDPYRRSVLMSATQVYEQQGDPVSGTTILVPRIVHPEAASIIAAGLSTQNNLLSLSANAARAKKIEYHVFSWLGGRKYRRKTDVGISILATRFIFGLTMDGMAERGTFSTLLTRLSGSLREVITGTKEVKG